MRKLAYVLQRSLPHGLLGWRYLFPGNDRRILAHRRVWWQSGERWPRLIWLGFELWLALRWRVFHALPACWRALRQFGATTRQNEGISFWRQAAIAVGLALAWGILPRQVYQFGLYRQPERALDYIYDHEVPAYQQWRNRARGGTGLGMRIIQDKQALAEKLRALGIPIVDSLRVIARSDTPPALASLLPPGAKVFCKTRSGNRGIGAFSACCENGELRGQTFEGQALTDAEAVEAAWRGLCQRDDALIQPFLENHPTLAGLAHNEEVITVRYISRWRGQDIACLSAALEVPAGRHEKNGRTYYQILPIEAENGRLRPFSAQGHWSEKQAAEASLFWEKAESIGSLPDWAALVEFSHRAHSQFTGIDAIAWDWVLTLQGPILLEGNTGWGTATPQIFTGGLLAEG
jgi:hypothetical protein